MKVYVNDKEIDLLPGMQVKHALEKAGLIRELEEGQRVYDEWGNEVGLDGSLEDNARLIVR